MSAQNHKLKINNSYESEPSSGSGLSLSDQNDCLVSDEENMHLPYLLKPPSSTYEFDPKDGGRIPLPLSSLKIAPPVAVYRCEIRPDRLRHGVPLHSSQESSFEGFGESPYGKMQRKLYTDAVAPLPLPDKALPRPDPLCHGVPLHSSQESSFEGFGESPYGKLQRELYTDAAAPLPLPDKALPRPDMHSNANIVFARFYDLIVEENSCNAVDMQVSNEAVSKEVHSIAAIAATDVSVVANIPALPTNSSFAELSFNGKIKSLSVSPVEQPPNSTALEEQAPLSYARLAAPFTQNSVSFILERYTNERSPDLFDDDDDDDVEQEVDNDVHNKAVDAASCGETANSSIAPEHKQLLHCSTNTAIAWTDTQSKEPLDTSLSNKSINCPTESSFADEQTLDNVTQVGVDAQRLYRSNCRREKELLRRIRKCLAGVPPPPSLTIPQLDMFGAVLGRKEEILNFLADVAQPTNDDLSNASSTASLFKPSHSLDAAKSVAWRDVLGVRQHGLCYNLNRASESNEYLGLSVVERFIGAETASSYRNSPSSAKKRSTRMKLIAQSPGNRLSHLAKRRSIFSSANLATTSQRANNLLGPQILVDKKKSKHRRKGTPKRRTPGSKKKNRNTPSLSARKRLCRNDLNKQGPSRETSKRALFQSPAKQFELKQSQPKPAPIIKPEIANRVEKSKRALFSPEKQSQQSSSSLSGFLSGADFNSQSQSQSSLFSSRFNSCSALQFDSLLKRKRPAAADDDVDTPEFSQNSKLFRGSAENLTPRALKIKSQSFCIGAGSSRVVGSASAISDTSTSTGVVVAAASLRNINGSSRQLCDNASTVLSGKMQRAHSDMTAQSNSLTENQRKKLLWAVSQALQEKKITTKHESFKQYAAVLARVVRRIFQEYYQKSSTSNSETMLRLSKRYAYHVITGKNADDIYLQAKSQIAQHKLQTSVRVSGYVGPEEYQQRKHSQQQQATLLNAASFSCCGSVQNLFNTDSAMDALSLSISQVSSAALSASQSVSGALSSAQAPFLCEVVVSDLKPAAQPKQPIQANAALQNSSSKNNLCGFALRENVNVECEQRRSAQKNFTGKDQRNISPYAATAASGTASLGRPQTVQLITELNSAKVKRQISFDN